MTEKQIAKRLKCISLKEKDIEKQSQLLNAEIARLQILCPHTKTTSDGGGYGGPDWASTYCDLCGKRV